MTVHTYPANYFVSVPVDAAKSQYKTVAEGLTFAEACAVALVENRKSGLISLMALHSQGTPIDYFGTDEWLAAVAANPKSTND